MKTVKPISDNVIRRLPRYLRKLDELNELGVSRVSSAELSRQFGRDNGASQIRQDFSCFGEFGQQGYGYKVTALRAEIASILGMNRGFSAILVGVGNIGRALMCNFDFSQWGFELKAAFDTKPELIGTEVEGIPVLNAEELETYLAENHVDAVVLCVPKKVAKDTALRIIKSGVYAIWNFTNVEITPEDYVEHPDYYIADENHPLIENIHFSDSLLSMSYWIAKSNDNKAKALGNK